MKNQGAISEEYDSNDFEVTPAEKVAMCQECNQIVSVRTTSVTVGDGEAVWETVCINGHLIDED